MGDNKSFEHYGMNTSDTIQGSVHSSETKRTFMDAIIESISNLRRLRLEAHRFFHNHKFHSSRN